MEWRPLLVCARLAVLMGIIHLTVVTAANSSIELRLVDGRYPNEGRVEVRLPGKDTWGSYCSNENPFYAGRLACRQLGFPALFSATAVGQFGKGTGPIWLEGISCGGGSKDYYLSLNDCDMLPWLPRYEVCDHRFNVGLVCFTGNLRLVGGKSESSGRVELHLGGDEWILLSHTGGLNFMYSDYICRHQGYPLSIGATKEKPFDTQQRTLCSYSPCDIQDESRSFFECIDDYRLKLCDEGQNVTALLGVRCANESEILPQNATFEFRLARAADGSHHKGIVEGRYSGPEWKTVCLQVLNEFRVKFFANDVCRDIGYPWATAYEEIRYSESADYVSTGDELVMREIFINLYENGVGGVRWLLGQDACQMHDYSLVAVECEKGVFLYDLTVFPCPEQTCRDRCGSPATTKLCGCDDLCPLCNDCCYDYADRCSLYQNSTGEDTELTESLSESFSCKLVDGARSVVIQGCSPEWNDTRVAQLCENDSLSGLVAYQDRIFFQNRYCVDCNGILIPDPDLESSSSSFSSWFLFSVEEYFVGIDECPLDTPLEIQTGCRSYSAIAYTPNGEYKNLHCAYCNSVNISAWDYCILTAESVRPTHLEILLGRPLEPWIPESSTSLLLQDKIHCYDMNYQLRVQPEIDLKTSMGTNESSIAEVTLCFLTTLGWQNIQLTWPLYVSYVESLFVTGEAPIATTPFLTNITGLEEILDGTVLPSHEEGSSRDWVVRCGAGQVDFVEICGTTVGRTQHPCAYSVYPAKAENLRAFNMSGVQIIYVGGGQLVRAESISYVRTYHYEPQMSNTSADKETGITVCGKIFKSEECRTPLVEEIKLISTDDGQFTLEYKGTIFEEDQVTYLPDDRVLICSGIFVTWEEPYISFSDPLTTLNTVGYSLSIVALLATFSNYCVFPVLRNVPGKAIMSLAAALFWAQLLALTVLDKAENQAFCIAMAVLMHFLWLSTFTWMNVLAFDLMRTFASKQASRPNKKVFVIYCLYGWGTPLLVVAACLIINFTDGHRLGFQYGGERSCWLVGRYAILGTIIVPLACSLIANAVLFGWTVRSVHASLVAAAMVRTAKSKSRQTLGEVWLYVKISCVMGFTWIFGCVGHFINHQALWYLFVILNSLQGVFIFASFGCNARVRGLWKEKLGIKKRRKATASQSTSTLSTTCRSSSSARGKIPSVSSGTQITLDEVTTK